MHCVNTARAAEAVGIDRITLQRWIRAGQIKAPKAVLQNGRGIRLWSRTDLEKLREAKKKLYRKGRGRKPKVKR